LAKLTFYLVNRRIVILVGIFIFLAADSLIAFKAVLLHGFGIYIIAIIKLAY